MDVMSSLVNSKTSFSQLLATVQSDFPGVHFESSNIFRWSDENQTIYYDATAEDPVWSLLHELGHMQRRHSAYHSDSALIRMEIEAWESAKLLGAHYAILIDEEHIQDCMDSYRNWQHKRSTCPVCALNGVEKRNGMYACVNCRANWQVGNDRFCRVYRRTKQNSLNAIPYKR